MVGCLERERAIQSRVVLLTPLIGYVFFLLHNGGSSMSMWKEFLVIVAVHLAIFLPS
jgi:hypothetical protein